MVATMKENGLRTKKKVEFYYQYKNLFSCFFNFKILKGNGTYWYKPSNNRYVGEWDDDERNGKICKRSMY